VVVKVSLLGDTDVSEPSKVDQLERVRRLVHQRSTQTNSLSTGESQDDSWEERDSQSNRDKQKNWQKPVFFVRAFLKAKKLAKRHI